MPESLPAAMPSLLSQLQSFISGVLTLDPADAALRAGLSLLVLIGAALVIWGLQVALKTIIERLAGSGGDPLPARSRKIGRLSVRIACLAIAVAAVLAILRVWGLDISSLMQGPVGAVLAILARVALILAVSLAAVEISQLGIVSLFNGIAARAETLRRASQLRTLAPVVAGVASTSLVVVAAMMALSTIGVEIGPLIAGAGIVGLAVGFGAQTLVKDFLTGIFLIIEDTVSVGDIVRVGDSGGLVEDMSLRTIKLRDFDGTLHVFPYSEAQVIHNLTKNFSYYVFDLSISYSSNIVKALDLMKATGEALRKEPEFAPMILEPIEVVGVDQLGDSGVVLKARIKTLPVKQWTVGREYLKRIKLAFDGAGIEIPFPHLKLVPPDAPIPFYDRPQQAAE
jgi:small conductance mechanosensitive channel